MLGVKVWRRLLGVCDRTVIERVDFDEEADAHLRAAVAVSPPLDLRAAQQRIAARRNRRYHHYLLARMREERPCPDDVKSILAFDDRVVAPANGFRDALDYYAQCSSGPRLGAIRTPTLGTASAPATS